MRVTVGGLQAGATMYNEDGCDSAPFCEQYVLGLDAADPTVVVEAVSSA